MSPVPGGFDHPARVLIVDDELSNRQLLEVMLAPEGYALVAAASGEEALAAVAREAPDLILLDIMMPGMDGYAVTAKIKSSTATRNIPVIMVTALDDRNARMLGLSAGAEEFLTKPVDRAELCVRVRNLLRLKAYSDYHDRYSQLLEDEVGSRTADLVASERLYRSTFDAAPVGIVHVGLDGGWQQVNQRLCDLLGYSREELRGNAARDLLKADTGAGEAEALRDMVAGTLDRYVVDEKSFRHRNGSTVWTRVNMSVYRNHAGQPQHLISVIEDITERQALEAQVRQASKMDAIGRLASGVAHDFNNLLTVILGFAELMTADPAITNGHGKDVGEIIKAARRAAGLTRQLLAFGRQQILRAAAVDVNALITDMTGMLTRLIGHEVEFVMALSPDLSQAFADPGQIEQVVMNLVVNARDAMPDGGTVTIRTADVELAESSALTEAIVPGHYVMLSVTDTGTGMTEDTQRRLFEPFFTTKELGKGTGLGLSTTYGIVKQSKGYIWVRSELGKGTTFNVYLPQSQSVAAVPAARAEVTAPVKSVPETVLLVDDEGAVRSLSKRILDRAGYHVLAASNGIEAEKLFLAHPGTIDLLLADVVMPECGGPELLRRLHSRSPDLPVVYMSGYTDAVLHKAGIDKELSFVQKPFTAAQLLHQVRKALDR